MEMVLVHIPFHIVPTSAVLTWKGQMAEHSVQVSDERCLGVKPTGYFQTEGEQIIRTQVARIGVIVIIFCPGQNESDDSSIMSYTASSSSIGLLHGLNQSNHKISETEIRRDS